ncbi:IPP transferase domain-containing protein [Hirsutella rhossiliensis]|uniref:tRNA dimethylallyltransferase n=1 Tax=Hirsutella rhossiliensis TaxID=111463 RepID=A0A9P8N587_9HYPO|nr:IPP transferase domain-containing protein [Hirsutella rhossiliensis]KAH0967858.1 IPP transferase domain-containing protein [Hirsutella rhossiliensis]
MATRRAPAEPLLVVLGSTGTGKSELAVELATRFRGEIINSDAMQLYNGLPVITNKISLPEQRGIPHHLLGHISLAEPPWDVEDFKRETTKVMAEIRARGNLPILVGGTHYYVDSLLFTDVILDDIALDRKESFAILDEPTDVLLEELRRCDPVMANRWHPNDRRKILRSLEIYLHTGKPASQLYAEQQDRKAAAVAAQPWEKLLFWVYTDREILCERLNQRLDKMLRAGLLDEVKELFRLKRDKAAKGELVDMSKGIWQSIGYRQFEPYLEALDEGKDAAALEQLKADALEDVKTATRRYANYQTRWTRLKQMRRLREHGPEALQSLYLLDSTDVSRFEPAVVEPAARLTEQFLHGESLPPATELSLRAAEVLTSLGDPPSAETPHRRACDVCQTVVLTEQAWARHVKGAAHRRAIKKRKKLALVPYEPPGGPAEAGSSSPPSSPNIASLF